MWNHTSSDLGGFGFRDVRGCANVDGQALASQRVGELRLILGPIDPRPLNPTGESLNAKVAQIETLEALRSHVQFPIRQPSPWS